MHRNTFFIKTLSALFVFTLGLFFTFLAAEIFFQLLHIAQTAQKTHFSQPGGQTSNPTNPLTIMCIGESVTAGYGEMKYPEKLETILKEKYPQRAIRVINLGRHKSTIQSFVNSLETDIEKYNPDVIISMLGINDLQTLLTRAHIGSRITPAWWHKLRSIYFLRSLLLAYRQKQLYNSRKLPLQLSRQREIFDTVRLHNFLSYDFKPERLDLQMYAKSPDLFSSLFWKAQILLDEGHAEKAATLLDEAIKTKPDNPEPYALKACALARANTLSNQAPPHHKPDPRIERLKKLCRQHCQTEQEFLYIWAYWHNRHGFYETARTACLEALKTTHTSTTAFEILLADMAKRQGQISDAFKLFDKILKGDPANLAALTSIAFMHYFSNAPQNAIPYLESCVQAHPESKSALDTLGIMRFEQKDYKTARPLLEQARRVYPEEDSNGMRYLVDIYKHQNQASRLLEGNRILSQNYRKIYQTANRHNIQLIAMQYPMRDITILKDLFLPLEADDIIFVHNTPSFENALKTHDYSQLFIDNFAGNFGHFTNLGAKIAAQNAASGVSKYMDKTAQN